MTRNCIRSLKVVGNETREGKQTDQVNTPNLLAAQGSASFSQTKQPMKIRAYVNHIFFFVNKDFITEDGIWRKGNIS
jgi:hypothetical protein